MRMPTPWVFALAARLLAGVTVDVVRAAPRATLSGSLQPYVNQSSTVQRVQAAILVQAPDCTGNLRIIHLLHRRSVRDRLHVAVIWYVGNPSDSLRIRSLLPTWTLGVTLQQPPRSVQCELARLGHHETPTLIVLDQEGAVRFASRSPRSPREFAGLQRIVEGLTWIEEL